MAPRRSLLAAAVALAWLGAGAVPGSPAVVEATNSWGISLSPMALVEGVPTDVKVTVNDGSETIGCVAIDLPVGFTVVRAGVSSISSGFVWTDAVAGTGPTRVTFSATSDGTRLNSGVQGVFTIRVIATASPLPAWTATAYKSVTVDSTQLDGGPSTAPGSFNIIASSGSKPTSTPAPAVAPTRNPASTAKPTPQPAATPPAPSGSPASSAAPSRAAASPSSNAIAAAESTPAGSGGVDAGGWTSVDVGALPGGGTVQLDNQAVGGIGMFAWVVPGLFLSLPGLLLLLIVVAQGAFATVFVPVTRRVLGLGRRRHVGGRPVLRTESELGPRCRTGASNRVLVSTGGDPARANR